MARSMAASRSNRQLSACLTMIASSAVTSFAAPSKSLFAKSRDFVRRDTLLVPRLSSSGRLRRSSAKLARQLRHFDGGEPRFESLVPALESGAVNGLLQCVARQHAKHNWQAAVHLRELQSSCSLRAHVIVMCRLAA